QKISTTTRQRLMAVHTNVTGPVSPPSFSGNCYAVIYTDSATRMSHIYFIRSKSGVFNTLRRYRTDVTVNTGYHIKTLLSDNGGEYTGRDISTYCTHHNIHQEFTNPYTPQDNGLAERQWRNTFPKARSIINSMDLPKQLWTETVATASHLTNLSPTATLKYDTPYHTWRTTQPDLSTLRVFGAWC
ncbi:unnamed protein product, partial [Choristocarpus tenellus]